MRIYEVIIQRATTYHVEAENEEDAIDRALGGEGKEVDTHTWSAECEGEAPAKAVPSGGWEENSDFPREDWKYEVSNGDTGLGYWDWVRQQVELHADGEG